MPDWIPIASSDECPPGTSIERIVRERVLAVANVDGMFYVIDGLCPHQGGPLGRGMLTGPVLTCPWHGWQFDVVTGQHKFSATVCQRAYEVCLREGLVCVRLSDQEPEPGVITSCPAASGKPKL